MINNQIEIVSSAYPEQIKPRIESKVHILLQEENIEIGQIRIQNIRLEDINELQLLQNEWFPMKYGKRFYNRIKNKQIYCNVAKCKIIKQQQNYNIIIGSIVYQITNSNGYCKQNNWLKSLFIQQRNSIYIMTLGIIDQFRRKGIAKKLINTIIQLTQINNYIKFIYLHVISYNSIAINFYKNNNFIQLQFLEKFYHIDNKYYSGLTLGYFVNGGIPKILWKNWINHLFNI